MERAPFEWGQPVERERETPPRGERRPRGERMPSGQPAFGQPYIWAAPRPRYVDDTPKMGRAGSAVFLGFLVLLAFGAVWVIERDVEGPAVTNEEVPQSAALESRADTPIASTEGESAQEPPPVIGSTEPPPDAPQVVAPGEPKRSLLPEPTRPTPPARIAPPQRPAPRAIANATPAPHRVPFPTSPPLSQRLMRTPTVEPAPAPPRMAVAEAAPGPLPRVPVEEPVLTPPAAPPPEPPPAPAAAAPAPVPTPASPPTPAPASAPAPSTTAASPAATRTAPAAAPTTAAIAPAGDVDSTAIRDVLGRYRSAFNTLDAQAAHQVWPTVNQRTLDRAFGQLQEQNVSFDRCTIAVKGVIAEANCNGTTRFVPRVGSRSEQIESRQWNFSLRKAYSGGWVIQEVEAR
jgi:hypothetical protein